MPKDKPSYCNPNDLFLAALANQQAARDFKKAGKLKRSKSGDKNKPHIADINKN